MKLSRYTLFFPGIPDKHTCMVFNTKTRAHIIVDHGFRKDLEAVPLSANNPNLAPVLPNLEKMGFIVPKQVDEKDMITEWFGKIMNSSRRLDVTVLTTYKCNFACTYCVEEGLGQAVHMNVDTAFGVCAFIKKQIERRRPEEVALSFYGGEPLMNVKPIRIIACELKEYIEAKGMSFGFCITTNGSLLVPELLDELIRLGLKGIQVTLDGMSEYHDKKRPFKNGKGSFSCIIANLLNAAGKIKINLSGNFDDENVKSFPALLDFLKECGLADKIQCVEFKPISPVPADRQKKEKGHEIACVYAEGKTARRMISLRRQILKKGFQSRKGVGINACGMMLNDGMFVIDPAGKLFRCPAFAGHDEFMVGSIYAEEIATLIPRDLWKRCVDCVYLPLCGNGCPFSSYVLYGDPERLNCQKKYIEYMIKENLKLNCQFYRKT
ncbi:MAG: radical SAM protein [Spirochaetales bacterium]|nr:radical SAM protein [Spirochaetales bacterium]